MIIFIIKIELFKKSHLLVVGEEENDIIIVEVNEIKD